MERYQYKNRLLPLLLSILIPFIFVSFFGVSFIKYLTELSNVDKLIPLIVLLISIVAVAICIVFGYQRYRFFILIDDNSIVLSDGKNISLKNIYNVDIVNEMDDEGNVRECAEIIYVDGGIKNKIHILQDLIGYDVLKIDLIRIAKENRDKGNFINVETSQKMG